MTTPTQPMSSAQVASPPRGLSSADAASRLQRDGANELTPAPRSDVLRQLLRPLISPLMLVLIGASIVAASVGEVTDAVIIIVTVLLGAALDGVQTARSTNALERLRRSVVPTATAERDGTWREIARRDVVVSDLIRLSAGDVVPADSRLITSRDLHVQQAALTGESFPAEKFAPDATVAPSGSPAASTDPHDPSMVFFGTSVVSGTGIARVFATGARTAFGEIAARLRAPPPPTELERGLARFGALLARTVLLLVLFLLLVSITLHREPLESLLFAVALAVGLVPEFMPMVTSMTLATGAVRMSRKHVIIKHLAAIHNFGSIDVLCSDKTGTLTSGEMRVTNAVDPDGERNSDVLTLAAVAAYFETGIQNPLDVATRSAAPQPNGWEKVDEIPFDFERRRASVVVRRPGVTMLITKGAPENCLAACTEARIGGQLVQIDSALRTDLAARIARMGLEGLRTIVVATKSLDDRDAYTRADERDLTLEGWLAFADPPLEDASATVAALAHDGVQLKILTGDDAAVTRHVCSSTGIDASSIVLGPELDHVSDAALGALAERTTVFARVTPQQKLRIIVALKTRGHVVGYMGDGINDAPSLHAADVGISVCGAIDVAKDAADIILMDRGLSVLHTGIIEGRKAFGNVMKYLLMGTSSNFGNMFSMAVASLIVPFLPMLPTQILLNNFLYDFSQIGIPSDRVDDAYVQKPHRWDMAVLRRFMVRIGLVSSAFDIFTFFVLLRFFNSSPPAFRTGWFVESLVTQTLVLLVIRTTGNPLRNRPSALFAGALIATLIVGIAIPYSPLGSTFGFARPPLSFLLFLVPTTAAYLASVEIAKRKLVPALLR
jgi:Mg2+-importing ATPase